MYVKSLKLNNFRNFYDEEAEFCPGVNIIYGKNAQGKTNLLESVWMFTGGHSFRGAKDSELIEFESESAKAQSVFISHNYEYEAVIKYFRGKKEIFINGIKKSGAELAGKFSAVVFSPEHLTLVKSGPHERRKFLDGAIARQRIRYAVILSKYNRTLQQRNALLKDIYRHQELREILPVWDVSLCRLGAKVVTERISYIEKLKEKAAGLHGGISGGKENLEVEYFSSVSYNSLESENSAFEKYMSILEKNRDEDIRAGTTQTGPHRDDIEIKLDSAAARIYASQGQQRSIVISLKLAEAAILKETIEEEPVIILDDVLSELDASRQDFLLNKIKNCQVFLSCCEPLNSEKFQSGKIFSIGSGRIKNVSSFGSRYSGQV